MKLFDHIKSAKSCLFFVLGWFSATLTIQRNSVKVEVGRTKEVVGQTVEFA